MACLAHTLAANISPCLQGFSSNVRLRASLLQLAGYDMLDTAARVNFLAAKSAVMAVIHVAQWCPAAKFCGVMERRYSAVPRRNLGVYSPGGCWSSGFFAMVAGRVPIRVPTNPRHIYSATWGGNPPPTTYISTSNSRIPETSNSNRSCRVWGTFYPLRLITGILFRTGHK